MAGLLFLPETLRENNFLAISSIQRLAAFF
jgi:hypothetical protein